MALEKKGALSKENQGLDKNIINVSVIFTIIKRIINNKNLCFSMHVSFP